MHMSNIYNPQRAAAAAHSNYPPSEYTQNVYMLAMLNRAFMHSEHKIIVRARREEVRV